MAKRVVPSQVVALVADAIPNIANDDPFKTHSEYAAIFRAVVDLAKGIPDELITLSGQDYVAYVHSLAALEHRVEIWSHLGGDESPRAINGRHPLRIIWALLRRCPDVRPSPKTEEMRFIKDKVLRDSIRLDLSSAYRSFDDGEWKPATVMAGAVTEALLLWSVQKNKREVAGLTSTPKGPPEKWDLSQLADVAERAGLIKKTTWTQVDLMRNYRNLILPGKALRLSETCTRGTAHAALAAADKVIEELS